MNIAADFVWQSYRQFGSNTLDLLAIEMPASTAAHRLKRIGLMMLAMLSCALVLTAMIDAIQTADLSLALRVLDVLVCVPIAVHLGSRLVRRYE